MTIDQVTHQVTHMKEILLIYPGPYGEPDPNYPIPLLYLAKPLIEAGFNVNILDTRIRHYESFDFSGYKVIGISVMTALYKSAQMITERIKASTNKPSLVWGGHHPSLLPEKTLEENPLIDFTISGEGEIPFLQLCRRLIRSEGPYLKDIPGLGFLQDNKIVISGKTDAVELDKTWELPYDLLSINDYSKANERFELYTSMGCPHSCSFCSNSVHARGWRGKSPEVVIDELERIKRLFAPKMISIFDANFFANKDRVRKICQLLIEKNLGLKFYAMGRCDYFAKYEPEFLSLMNRAGFSEIAMGAESGSPDMLEYFNKGFSPEAILRSVDNCVKAGMKPIYSFVIAAPGETKTDLYATLKLYDDILAKGGFVNGIFLFTPYPGSKIVEEISSRFDLSQREDLYTKSLYDIKSIGCHTKEYERICQAISYSAHLFYVHSVRRSWSFSRKLKRDRSMPAVIKNDLIDSVLYTLAKLRWRSRFFRYAFDLRLYWFLRNKTFSTQRI